MITPQEIQTLKTLYFDENKGLTSDKKLYEYLHSNGHNNFTYTQINEFLKSLEVNQVLTKRRVV